MESKDKKPESYKKVKELGKGACGKAYLVKCESNGDYAVIKQIDVNAIKSREEREKVYQVGFELSEEKSFWVVLGRELNSVEKLILQGEIGLVGMRRLGFCYGKFWNSLIEYLLNLCYFRKAKF